MWAPGTLWAGAENLATTGIRSRTVQSAASSYTDWAIPAYVPLICIMKINPWLSVSSIPTAANIPLVIRAALSISRSLQRVLSFLHDFNQICTRVFFIVSVQPLLSLYSFTKTLPLGANRFHADDRQTDRQLIVPFIVLTKAPQDKSNVFIFRILITVNSLWPYKLWPRLVWYMYTYTHIPRVRRNNGCGSSPLFRNLVPPTKQRDVVKPNIIAKIKGSKLKLIN